MLDSKLAFGPFAGRGVVAKEEESEGSDGDEDEWHDERYSPCNVG
jgi:hypothetical protein